MWRTIPALAVLLIAQVSQADDAPSWIGVKVVLMPQTPLRIGGQIVDDGSSSRSYTVRQVHGDWLWLVSTRTSGWVRSDRVVRLDQAVTYFTEQIEKGHDPAYSHLRRGLVWYLLGDQDQALADLEKASNLGLKDISVELLRAASLIKKGDRSKAFAIFNEAIRLNPRDARAWEARGVAWSRSLELEKALADFNEAIRLSPSRALSHHVRAMIFMATPDWKNALADFNEAIRLNPYLADAYMHRARLFTHGPVGGYRDLKKGLLDARHACELTYWEDPDSLEILADACAESSDFKAAIRWQEKANGLITDEERRQKGEYLLKLFKDLKEVFEKNSNVKSI